MTAKNVFIVVGGIMLCITVLGGLAFFLLVGYPLSRIPGSDDNATTTPTGATDRAVHEGSGGVATSLPEPEPRRDDLTFRADFNIRGTAEDAVFTGKTYYILTDRAVYVVTNSTFEMEDGFSRGSIIGGDAYIIESADLESFTILPSFTDGNDVAKDKNHVYHQGKIIKNAHPATFELGPDFDTCEYTDGQRCFNLTVE